MGRKLLIREDVATASELRRLAEKEPRRRTAQRMLAIANALDGMSRAEAARGAGIERQSLRDAVTRFNAEGLAGLRDRPPGHRPEVLSEGEQAVVAQRQPPRPPGGSGACGQPEEHPPAHGAHGLPITGVWACNRSVSRHELG